MLQEKPTKQTAIYLSDKDIELFKLFRQFQDMFSVLTEAGVFDIKKGKAVLNFNNGKLLEVKKEIVSWRKRKTA